MQTGRKHSWILAIMQPRGELAESGRLSAARTVLELVTWAVAAASIAAVLLTVALRITYPYELEWMEGGVLQHIDRLRAGEPIYTEPTFRFVPFIYPPLYYYLSSAAMQITGEGFPGPRMVSLAASLGCMGVIFLFVARETGRKLPALCAAALYAATFNMTEGWFDLARVDSLFPLFVLGGAFLIRFGNRAWTAAAAGLLLTCAFFTKQSTVVFAAPLLLYHLVYARRRFPALVATSVALSGLLVAYLHWQSGGWFTYYVFALPRQHPWELWSLDGFWRSDILPHVPIALVMTALAVAARYERWRRRPAFAFYAALVAGALGTSWLSRLHTGGGVNVVLPALAVTAILFGLAMAHLPEIIDELKRASRKTKDGLKAAVLVAAMVQLLLLASNPMKWVPAEAARKAGDELVARIEQFDGDVMIPTAPYLAARAGKPTTVHHMALMDVLRATGSSEIKEKLLADVNRGLADPRCEAILLYRKKGWFDETPIPDDFRYEGRILASPEGFRPRSGATEYVPLHLFVRRGPAVSPP